MSGKLKWRFDASTFKLLGRGLITDRITAIYELVKNCYDANSTKVTIDFSKVDSLTRKSTITIIDNGLGMSLDDITDKWLVVGTASKRKSRTSAKPFCRRYIGEKGVGRFATDKLGGHLKILTKRKIDNQILNVEINWSKYERNIALNKSRQQLLFTDLENDYEYTDANSYFKDGHGTALIMTILHEAWDKEMLLRLENQLSRILPPINKLDPPFNIFINAPDLKIKEVLIVPEPIEQLATVHVKIAYDYKKGKQETVYFNEQKERFINKLSKKEIFGPVKIDFYYFDTEAQKQFKTKYKNTENFIEGIKIYRDGVICTPFAEYESVLDKRRDIIGVDKRRFQEAFDKLSSRQFIGIVYITKDENPKIIDATNRQDFTDTPEYRRLKEFIIEQIDELAEYRKIKRSENKVRVQNNLKKASADVKHVSQALSQIIKDRPELKKVLAPAIAKANDATNKVSEGVKESLNSEKEFLRKEALYLSLMSLQDFANELAHGIRFALSPAKHAAEYLVEYLPKLKIDLKFTKYAKLIFDQTEVISKLVDFMLSYAQVDVEDSEFMVKDFLEEVILGPHAIMFQREGITVEIEVKDNIQLYGKRKFLEDVLSNLISNSKKALKDVSNKKILCQSYADDKKINIIFSDNGNGINPKIKDTMFEMFKTTTAEQGGAGLGLFISRSRMSALNGTIKNIKSIFSPKGASFKLTLPLKAK